MSKTKISLVMVIHNEEKVLKRALDSAYDLVNEIIIIHDGKCEDNSIKIAKKYTNKIFFQPHLNNAEHHRIYSY